MSAQRLAQAATQLQQVTRERPDLAPPFLTLGALRLELRQPAEAEAALQRYLQLSAEAAPAGAPADTSTDAAADTSADTSADDADEETADDAAPAADPGDARRDQGATQARLLLSQAAEQRGDYAGAQAWLDRIGDRGAAFEVQRRRAGLLARQGRVDEARELIRHAPERQPGDARAKLLAEAAMLREVKRWDAAYDVLGSATGAFADDVDLLYEQAMVAEKLGRLDDMERLLRQVIALKPDDAHAYNALGYSLADRGERLPEARELIRRALELSPGDPFITDSMGWVEVRLGNLAEAERLLRQAHASRPDAEIGAHLGEVLWVSGQRDEARRVWAEARQRDAANEVLGETLKRLKVDL
jgi:tetratricopeptide (TPR) repeat protein